MSFTEVISNTTVWIEATAVYLSAPLAFTLTETTGGGGVAGSVAAGAYTKTTFATAFSTALSTASANGYTYTASSDQVNYLGMPNTTPVKYGGSWTVTKTGAGNFFISIP